MGVMEILDAPEGREGAHDESRLVSTLARQAAVTIETDAPLPHASAG